MHNTRPLSEFTLYYFLAILIFLWIIAYYKHGLFLTIFSEERGLKYISYNSNGTRGVGIIKIDEL